MAVPMDAPERAATAAAETRESGGTRPGDGGAKAEPVEVEAKLRASRAVFRAIEGADEIAGWRVASRRTIRLRDTYWDTPDRRLAAAGCTLRVREQDGGPVGELTFKGRASYAAGRGGAGSRTELTVAAPAGSGPDAWQGLPEAAPVLAAVRERTAPAALRRDVVMLNPRRELVLRRDAAAAALTLDEVALEGQPYRRRYVEIELMAGSRADFDALVAAVAQAYDLRPARSGKVQGARAWLAKQRAKAGGAGSGS